MPSQLSERKRKQRESRVDKNEERNVVGFGSSRYCRVSSRKARDLADMIRGMRVDQALQALKFTHRPSAQPMMNRLLLSVLASVKDSHTKMDRLYVGDIYVDVAGMLKRFHPRAFGRAARIRKRSCHISMELVERS